MKKATCKRTGLKVLRVSRGLTQKDMADKLGVTRGTLSTYESGSRDGSLSFWFKLQRVFGLTNDELVNAMKRGDE